MKSRELFRHSNYCCTFCWSPLCRITYCPNSLRTKYGIISCIPGDSRISPSLKVCVQIGLSPLPPSSSTPPLPLYLCLSLIPLFPPLSLSFSLTLSSLGKEAQGLHTQTLDNRFWGDKEETTVVLRTITSVFTKM